MSQFRTGPASRRLLTCAVIPCWLVGAACLVVMASRGASSALVIAWLMATAASVVVTWRADLPPPRPAGGASRSRLERARLDGQGRELLRRAQAAIAVVRGSEGAAADGLLPAGGAAALGHHEQEITATLREITTLRAELDDAGAPAARGPMTEAVIAAQQRALGLAVAATTARVAALERLAAQVQAADAARLDWHSAHRRAGRNDRYLDLLARTAADEHAVAEITGLAEQAARAAQALRESLRATGTEAEVLAVPAALAGAGPGPLPPPSPGAAALPSGDLPGAGS
jgi:hypothetical protein